MIHPFPDEPTRGAATATIPASSSLNAARRAADLHSVGDGTLDLLVVGGGATGAGVALDAASRGLSVALVERRDFAHGTSRWSSKLIHGGLRYLASGDVGLAWESARERAVLMSTVAPHLVRAMPMVLPINTDVSHRRVVEVVGAYRVADGLKALARTPRQLLPRARRLSLPETLSYVPGLQPEGLRGGLLSWDGQLEDDARLVVAIARTAALHGARVLTRVSATELRPDGATLVDELSGARLSVQARAVVNATGVWASELSPHVRLQPSKGVHIVVRSAELGSPRAAVTVPMLGEHNRFALVVPQPDGLTYIGLTDDPIDGPLPDVPQAGPAEIDFLLSTVGRALAVPLTAASVVGTFAGLRPLAAGVDESGSPTADLSRRHVVDVSDGVITVYGGKLTTYRRMAQDTVDIVADGLGIDAKCRTRELPLMGAARGSRHGARLPARLIRRYGSEAGAVAGLADHDPGLLEPVAPGLPVLGVEFAFGILHEGALTVEDLLERRTRLSMVPGEADQAEPAARRILERYGAIVAP